MSGMAYGNAVGRRVDIVMCIDGTGSMAGCIDNVKTNIIRLYETINADLEKGGNSVVEILRIKFITFRDYKSDGEQSMVMSRFFELPNEKAEVSAYLAGIKATGGCGEDANGLEAFYLAMKSDFVATGAKDRQIIVIFADTPPIPALKRSNYPFYPKGMPDANGLLDMWTCGQEYGTSLSYRGRRLILFAPENSEYKDMGDQYDNCMFIPVEIHNGLSDVSFDTIAHTISSSISSR